jgi:acetyltransferase-like isoleucine patch superfamily enzyme
MTYKLPLREIVLALPGYVWYALFWWIYPTTMLRQKAAICPSSIVRMLMLRRSGVYLGDKVVVSFGVLILGRGRQPAAVHLGDRVAVAPYAVFITSSYPESSRLMVHPDVQRRTAKFRPIRVEQDAWIGAGAIIMPGITIGQCAIVGAGAVVTKDVPSYTVVAGVPGRAVSTIAKGTSPGDET